MRPMTRGRLEEIRSNNEALKAMTRKHATYNELPEVYQANMRKAATFERDKMLDEIDRLLEIEELWVGEEELDDDE